MESLSSMSNLNLSEEEAETSDSWYFPLSTTNPIETSQNSTTVDLPVPDKLPSFLASYLEEVPTKTANLSEASEPSRTANLRQEKPLPSTLTNAAIKSPAHHSVCNYLTDIWANLVKQEIAKAPLQLQSPQLKFRGALVEYLRNITKKLDMHMGTLHLAVSLLDTTMDSFALQEERLIHVALACLSLAAKSEEKFNTAVKLHTLRDLTGISIRGDEFRELEFLVGDGVKWRLLTPTPASFASLLSHLLVTDAELITKRPEFIKRFKKDAAKFVDSYLDVTLSDVRLKVVDAVTLGCACVACARVALSLNPWSAQLAEASGREYCTVAPIARRLQRKVGPIQIVHISVCMVFKDHHGWSAQLAEASGRVYCTVAPIARRLQRMMQMLRQSERREGDGFDNTTSTTSNSAKVDSSRCPSVPVGRLSRILKERLEKNPMYRLRDSNTDAASNPSHFKPPANVQVPSVSQHESCSIATKNPSSSNNPGTSKSSQSSGNHIIVIPHQLSAHQNASSCQVPASRNPRIGQSIYTGSGTPQAQNVGTNQNTSQIPGQSCVDTIKSFNHQYCSNNVNSIPNCVSCQVDVTVQYPSTIQNDGSQYLNSQIPVTQYPNSQIPVSQHPSSQMPVTHYLSNQIPGTHYPSSQIPCCAVDLTRPSIDNSADYRYCKSLRLLDADLDMAQPSTSMGFKRAIESTVRFDNKRIYRG